MSPGSATQGRKILLVAHPRRQEAQDVAAEVVERLHAAGIEVVVQRDEATAVKLAQHPGVTVVDNGNAAAEGCELVSGARRRRHDPARRRDRARDRVAAAGREPRPRGLPRRDRARGLARRSAVVARDYEVEQRLTVDVVGDGPRPGLPTWALNEVTVEKAARERMLEIVVEVDGRPLHHLGATAWWWRHPPAPPRTRSPPAGRWSGRRSRPSSWCRSAPTPCSPGRWWSGRTSGWRSRCSRAEGAGVLWADGRRARGAAGGPDRGRRADAGASGPAGAGRSPIAWWQVPAAGRRLARRGPREDAARAATASVTGQA